MRNTRVHRRLHRFYDELTSVDAILRVLAREGLEEGSLTAADLYTRSLDCQNHGDFTLLERHAALVAEYKALGEGQRVLGFPQFWSNNEMIVIIALIEGPLLWKLSTI
jgi:hypothetical protein